MSMRLGVFSFEVPAAAPQLRQNRSLLPIDFPHRLQRIVTPLFFISSQNPELRPITFDGRLHFKYRLSILPNSFALLTRWQHAQVSRKRRLVNPPVDKREILPDGILCFVTGDFHDFIHRQQLPIREKPVELLDGVR